MSRFLAVALLLACTSVRPADIAADTPRLQAHEPFVRRSPQDGLLCDRSIRAAIREVTNAVNATTGSSRRVEPDPRLAEAWTASGFDPARSAALIADKLPLSRPQHRLRVDLAPQKKGECVAIRISEECGPDLAPEGDPREWHACGDPQSGGFLQAKNRILETLGVTALEND